MNPDVTVAVPAVITVDPDPTFMRWMVMDFDDRLGGSHANYDLRESSGRNETDSKNSDNAVFFTEISPSMASVHRPELGKHSGRLFLSTRGYEFGCAH